jgi:NAD(P)-dependent dehydrogenase (short-subunit alcohol dehydrogenase family)
MGGLEMRLSNKTAIVVGAGQQPGETIGNGRATAIRFAQEGANVLVVDKNLDWADDTLKMIEKEGGKGKVQVADITKESDCAAIAKACIRHFGKIDILHNNVGRSEGDTSTVEMDPDIWDKLMAMNLKGMFMTCKYILPVMREQQDGVIINISSIASICTHNSIAYKTGKGAVNTMTHHLAMENAEFGIRANAILPGLMDTPMAIERRAREQNVHRDEVRKGRHDRVPLLRKMGTAWDVANAAVFLASDDAQYITGLIMPVDGGLSSSIG